MWQTEAHTPRKTKKRASQHDVKFMNDNQRMNWRANKKYSTKNAKKTRLILAVE